MRRSLTLGILFTVCLTAAARADDQHYQDFIVGDEAVGLGGAYAAIASDPSGGWYNPAGIVDVRDTSLSLSANLYGIQDNSTGKATFVDPENAISKLSIVPSSAGFVQSLGYKNNYGKRPFAVGMSLVVPSYRKYSISEEGVFNDPVLGRVHSGYNRKFTDSTLWAGLLGAARLANSFSLGLGLYLVHRSVQDSAFSYVATDASGDEYTTYRAAMTDLDFSNYAILAAMGMKWEIANGFFFGAMVRSPSLTVYSDGTMRFARARADGLGGSTFLPTPEGVKVETEERVWGEARAGLAYVIPELFKISADVSGHLPSEYTMLEVDDPVAEAALLIPRKVKRNMVINGNLGVEVTIMRKVSIGLGGFTNFSSAPAIPKNVEHPHPAHVNMYGGTLAVGYASEHTLTRVGFQYSYGEGYDVHAVNDPSQLATDEGQQFVRVPLTQSYMYFFLSSTFRY